MVSISAQMTNKKPWTLTRWLQKGQQGGPLSCNWTSFLTKQCIQCVHWSGHVTVPVSLKAVLILRCSEHFCRPSQRMTVERLTLRNTEERFRPSAGFWHGGENQSTCTRARENKHIDAIMLSFHTTVPLLSHRTSLTCSLFSRQVFRLSPAQFSLV